MFLVIGHQVKQVIDPFVLPCLVEQCKEDVYFGQIKVVSLNGIVVRSPFYVDPKEVIVV